MNILYRKTYANCSELPLLNFIKCLTKDDLNQLLSDKDGWRLKPDLQAVWDDIFMEYTELSQDQQGTHIFELIKEIQVLRNKINLIQECINLLSRVEDVTPFKITIDTLKKLAGVFLPFTNETIAQDLVTTANKAKSYVIQYETVLQEYQSIAKVEQAKATEMDYMEELAIMREHFQFDSRKISTMEYIALKKTLKQKV